MRCLKDGKDKGGGTHESPANGHLTKKSQANAGPESETLKNTVNLNNIEKNKTNEEPKGERVMENKEINFNKSPKSKTKLRKVSGLLAALMLIIIAVSVFISQRTNKQSSVITAELAKAMTYDTVEEGDEKIDGAPNVEFDAFFLRDINNDGYADGIRGTCNQVGNEDTLYMELNVLGEGYLRDAKITINSENFYFQGTLPKDNELKDNFIGSNIEVIEFNNLSGGTQKTLTGMVRSGDYTYKSTKIAALENNTNNYSKVNSVTLTGTYVNAEEETTISKTVEFDIDWYEEPTAEMPTYVAGRENLNQEQDLSTAINEEDGTFTVNFKAGIQEIDNDMLLSKAYIEGEIPDLNGYAPQSVEITGTNVTYTYNELTGKFTAQREAITDENGNITSQAYDGIYSINGYFRYNNFDVKITYPIEAYQSIGAEAIEYKIPIRGYYEGYNNPSEEFTNPVQSNTASGTFIVIIKNPDGEVAGFDVTVGKIVYNPTWRYVVSKAKPLAIYNGTSETETDDTYTVIWEAYTGTEEITAGMIMKETKDGEEQVSDAFIKTDSTEESADDLVQNVGIYFTGADLVLGSDGYINVYDEDTGNLLVTFTSSDWNKYTVNNPYEYEIPVKHIRVETSVPVAKKSVLYVHNIKEIDDEKITQKYERDEFDSLQYIKSTLAGYLGDYEVNTTTHQAYYEAPISVATISISNNAISTQVTDENNIITITANANTESNQIAWKNGIFLVKLPEEIISAQINGVQISNSSVSIESYELIEQDGNLFIKIVTKNDSSVSYNITIDIDLSPDPRRATATTQIELYASNESATDYYSKQKDQYDVNNNLNTEEYVNYATTSLRTVSPNSLLTNQVATNYDDAGNEIVSPEIADIKPVYAVVDQENVEEQTATIGVQIRNNYGSTVSEIQILGKIPFEGNTYVLSGGDLGSSFSTKMVEGGIVVPSELEQYATVYYSENENPNNDVNDESNGWVTANNVANWDNIKTYLIDLNDYVMGEGEEYIFSYTVRIPNGLEFNQVSYSHHGVYFCLDTEEGKYRTSTEPNRLGFRIAEKFDLELTKYQTGKDTLVPGATYSVTEINTNETGEEIGNVRTGVTNSQGKITIANLYAEKTYEIKETKSPDDYELNSEVIRFITHVDEQGNLSTELLQGTTRGEVTTAKEEGENYKVQVAVEDEAKATLKILKQEQNSETTIQGVRFKITGYGLPETGRTLTTNRNGEATLSGLYIDEEYTLEEVKAADGYYIGETIRFKIVNNNQTYEVQIINDGEGSNIKNSEVTEENSIPTLSLTLGNEAIPTYSLQLIKIERTVESTISDDELIAEAETSIASTEVKCLEGAKFKLYKDGEEIGEYTTGASGTVTIPGLYQYVAEKGISQTYTLKEVLAPDGYAKVNDITFKAEVVNGALVLTEINGQGEETTSTRYSVSGNTINLTIEDSPSFKLIKKDAETGEVLANIKFAIYNVDDGTEKPATNSKGEIIGTKETIDGKEYYVVATDENGVLTADLTEGLYKAVEVQAPEQYDLEGQEYYFGIGASREAQTIMAATQGSSIGGSDDDQINSVAATSDGGYIAGGYFASESITIGGDTLTNVGGDDGMVVKYNEDGEVEWATSIGGSGDDQITSVAETTDGYYIVGGYFNGTITVGEETLTSAGNYGNSDGIVIKYSSSGNVVWLERIGDTYLDEIASVVGTSDGGYLVGGRSAGTITAGGETLTIIGAIDGVLIKYRSNGSAEWITSIGGVDGSDRITSVTETTDGYYIVGGYFQSSSFTVGNYTLTNAGGQDGMVIKYSSNGSVEWATSIGGSGNDQITSVAGTSDGGYIAGSYFNGTITVGGETLTSAGGQDGMVIKYSSNGSVERAESIGGSSTDQITSVEGTSDGGFIVGGYFGGTITVGEEILTSAGGRDGMIIKYSSNGEVKWGESIRGNSTDQISSVAETSDGGYIAGGYFRGTITGGEETLTSAGSYDGMIIKFESVELGNPITLQAQSIGGSSYDQITSVAGTSDGGYIAGGYFAGTITVGEETLTSSGQNGMIIKYGSSGSVEWAEVIRGSITSVAGTSDGGYIVGGYFQSSSFTVGNYTLTNAGSYDGMIIKYSSSGSVEWATSIGGSSSDQISSVAGTSDGGYIVGGYFQSSSFTVGNYILTNAGGSDGMIIKYSSNGSVEWATSIGGSNTDQITSVAGTSDGDCIVGGYFQSSSLTVGNYTLTNAGNQDGMIIKYSSNGSVEWATSIGGSSSDQISSVAGTSGGGYIVGGTHTGTITVGENTLTGTGAQNGMVIKYNKDGEVEWARTIGASSLNNIFSIAGTSDGGYVVGGYFWGTITVGNYTLTSAGGNDGMVIKYSSSGEVEWAKGIGGSNYDYFYSVTEANNGEYIAGGYYQSPTIETDGKTLENAGNTDGMILKIANQVGVPEVQELTVENSIKEFEITTDIEEIDGVKGGSITGEGRNPYERVKYGDNSTLEIKMTPEEGFEIIKITINGENVIDYETDPDGSYKLPQFTNVTEDKHIVVTYAKTSNKITIVKQDAANGNALSGTKFKLDQIEERTDPENVIGSIVDNGTEYPIADTSNEVTEQVLGVLTNNGTYHFVEKDGTLVPTNSKTYQTEIGGSAGVQNTTANSYMEIDLSSLEGEYVVVVNASVSSQNYYDYGYATINTTTNAPTYSSSTGRFIYIAGTVEAKDYTSTIALEGGNKYYLHLGYRKDSSTDTGDDQIVINSVNVYEAAFTTYNFVSNGQGGYESNNQGADNTTANSYIPIDLTGLTGKYNLTVNANVSSQSYGDYGYATISTTTDAPAYNTNSSSAVRFIYISGTSTSVTTPTDYTTVLEGGSKYYLHLGYRKDSSTSTGDDKFTVNSINISPNDSDLRHVEIETDIYGNAVTQLPYGKYILTEVQAPEGYEPMEEPITIEFRQDGNSVAENNNDEDVTIGENGEFIIENNEKAKVVVHHYLKNEAGEYTTTKVAEDDYMEGKIGESYTTLPHLDLERYQLEKDEEGNYVMPEHSSGTYVSGTQEVTYFYEVRDVLLKVHHYIEGTEESVPLADGSLALDEEYTGKEGEGYTTDALTAEELNEKYELASDPENSSGTYTGNEIIVTYYYKLVRRPLTIIITGEDGEALEGVKYRITNTETGLYEDYTTNSDGKITVTLDAGAYEVTEIETVDGYKLPDNPTQEINITKDQDSYSIEKQSEKIPAEVIVHHYIYNRITEEYTEEKVPSKDGGVVEDEVKTGVIGDMYASKASENIAQNYEYVSSVGNTSGEMTLETIEVIYYYQIKDGKISENTVETTKTDKITEEDQEVSYTISYNPIVDEYIGDATVSIVIQLPFEIDEEKSNISNIDGAVYNADEKTITLTKRVEDINTYTNGPEELGINENITVVYTNMDYSKTSFDAVIQGTLTLEETNQVESSEEVVVTTETEFTKDVSIAIIWDHTNNIYGIPAEVNAQVKKTNEEGQEVVVDEKILNSSNKTEDDENTWVWTFTGLQKYDSNGNEINYTAGQTEVNEGELNYYREEIDGTTIRNTYNGPVLVYSVTSEIIRNENSEDSIPEGSVTAGDRIKYTIHVHNVGGEAITDVEIKNAVPEGTTIYVINDDGQISLNDTNVITWNIDEVAAGEEKQVSFEVTVGYDTEEKTIINTAEVNGVESDRVEIPYVVPNTDLVSSIVKDGTQRITTTEETIGYTIKHEATIKNFEGKGTLRIVDYLPYEIDEENSDINGGTYDKDAKTITWEEDLGAINTYVDSEGTTKVEKTKTLTLKYVYTDEENLSGTIENRAEGTIALIHEQEVENPENPGETNTVDAEIETLTDTEETDIAEETVKEETVEDIHQVTVAIPAKVIVHHYIYDEDTGEYTQEQVPSKDGGKVADETIDGIVRQSYETAPSDNVNENYECVNATPDKFEGTMTKTDIVVTYYYKLKAATVNGSIEKTATASKQEEVQYDTGEVDEEGNPIFATKTVEVLTEEDGVITYRIAYRVKIDNYQGKAKIKIVDSLPASLAEEDTRVDLDGGTYNAEYKTITWEEEVDVNTVADGKAYEHTFEKEIEVVYKDQNVLETLVNEVTGTATIYYPEGHTTTPGGERGGHTASKTAEVEQEYYVTKEVEAVWDDNDDKKGNRPDSVTVQLTANGSTSYNGNELEKVVLDDENDWKHLFEDLPKYDEDGKEIVYSVEVTETYNGDLEYYDDAEVTIANDKIIVTNKYKLMNTELQSSIDTTGTSKITSSKDEVTYDINYNVSITEYIGEVLVKVVYTLPYEIDEENSDIAEGTYDKDTKTITWEQKIDHINTYTSENGSYEIDFNKTIELVYSNLDVTQRSMTSHVKATIDLYETEKTETIQDTYETSIEVPGKVIVKYVDNDTDKEITYVDNQGNEKTYRYEINGLAGDEYTTEQKDIPIYTYVENSGNTTGSMTEGTIEVIYYYEKMAAGGVNVIYVDEDGNKIEEGETYTGKIGDTYTTEQKDIYGYEFVRAEGETEGKMTEEAINVVYVYKKIPAKVIVRYLEKDDTEEDDTDNTVLYPEVTIEGYVGDDYTTIREVIENYQPAEPEPENKEGKMTPEDIYVTYYYEKIPSGKVIALYIDVDTNAEILYKDEDTEEYKSYREETQEYIGDKYVTEQKDIPYYKIVEELLPENREGEYTAENIEVRYYYQKLGFNIEVDNNVEKIMINGTEQKVIDGKINKVEVVGSQISSTDVEITYSIKVSNTGELEGTATLLDTIPENFSINKAGTSSEWTENESGNLETTVTLKPGETKELKVVLNWKNGNNSFCVQHNIVEIVSTENLANYEETTLEDNRSGSEVVMSIKTGDAIRRAVIIASCTGMLITLLIFLYITDKYVKEYKEKNGIK